MPRFDNPIELPFAGEAAASLGQAGRKLKRKLEALRRYDADVAAHSRKPNDKRRESLVRDAGEAFWGYVVQREQLGLLDSDYIAKEYEVPADVKRAMGPKSG
ncbi:MAG TPA: DUF6665 family protein [Steroidobacter sp.]|uniref:DUF6665 family protein n=1 Tax=Steroidobacter sp. TaxID=1978227 RepID=UPI002ED9D43C